MLSSPHVTCFTVCLGLTLATYIRLFLFTLVLGFVALDCLVLNARGTDTVFICLGEPKYLTCENPGAGSVTKFTEECSTLLLCARSSCLGRQFG